MNQKNSITSRFDRTRLRWALPIALALWFGPLAFSVQAQYGNKNSVLSAILNDNTTVGVGAENLFWVSSTWGAYYESWCPYGRASQAFNYAQLYVYTSGRARVSWSVGTSALNGSYLTVAADGAEKTRVSGYSGYQSGSVDYTSSGTTTINYNCYSSSDAGVISRLWVDTQPVFYQTPTDVYAASGSYNVSMTAKAYIGAMTYQWYDRNNNYLGSGSQVNFSASQSTAGRIRCTAYNNTLGYSYTTDTYANLYLIETPVMTSQPTSVVAGTGNTVSFYANANNYQLFYQWYKSNGSAISGANSYYLYLYNVTSADAGGYYCRISNGAGSVQSSSATLTIATLPVITVQPMSITRNPGSTATFSVTATGIDLSYQWYKNSTTAVASATSASYSITNVVLADAGNFQVKVSNVAGTIWSSNAVLTTIIPPAITVQPVSLVVTQSNPATFFVTASGSTAAYQWWKGSVGSPTLLSEDFTTNNGGFVVQTPIPFAGAWAYNAAAGTWCEDGQPTNNNQPNTSKLNSPVVTLSHAGNVRLTFAHRYAFQGSLDGGQVRLSTNGGPYTAVDPAAFSQNGYRGELLQLLVPSGLESELKGQQCFTDMSRNYSGYPWARFDTSVANLGTMNAGDTVSVQFMAASDNTGSSTAPNWEIDSVSLQVSWNDRIAIAGATATNYTIANAQVADAAPYSVVLTNAAGSVTSVLATLTVLVPPVITTQPLGALLVAGASTNLSVTATGTLPLAYQWQFKSVSIAGATNSSLIFGNLTLAQSGPYRVIVTNIAGGATSAVATVTVMLPPSISAAPSSVFTNLGSDVVLRVATTGGGTPSYQWYFRDQPLGGWTNATLMLARAESQTAGDYWVRVRNQVASVDSSRVWVLLGPVENMAVGWGDSSVDQISFTSDWTNLVTLSGGDSHTLGLRGDGTVLATGANDAAQSTVPSGLARSVAVAAGAAHSLALRENSTVMAWGANDFGQTNVPA
ncbi:MAG: immunoglobulin domain-containing protein, partial [Verrucomicrobiota bacterium]